MSLSIGPTLSALVLSEKKPTSGKGRHSYHIPSQDNLAATQILMQIGLRKRRRMILRHHFLAIFGFQLRKLLGQFCVGREDGRTLGHLVNDVHDLAVSSAVLFEERGDGLATGRRVGAL